MIGLRKSASRRFDPLDSLLGYHVRRLSVLTMADLAESLAPLGLTPTSASILFIIGSNAGLTQSDVGKYLGVLRANMAPLAAALIDRGLVEREPLDGRSQALRLSVAGRALHRRAWKAVRGHEKRMFGTLTPAVRARLVSQLRSIWRNTESPAGAGA